MHLRIPVTRVTELSGTPYPLKTLPLSAFLNVQVPTPEALSGITSALALACTPHSSHLFNYFHFYWLLFVFSFLRPSPVFASHNNPFVECLELSPVVILITSSIIFSVVNGVPT